MRRFLPWAFVTFALLGCGNNELTVTQSTTGDAGDGRYHPEPNGTHVSEDAACQALVDALSQRRLAMSCVGTTPQCPSPLIAEFGTRCMEYDQGSVSGCVAYYGEAMDCDALNVAFDDCVITPYPGTQDAGCP